MSALTTEPPVALLDTTSGGLAETGAKVAAWIRTHLSAGEPTSFAGSSFNLTFAPAPAD